jgi:superoxide dismutase
MTRPDVSEVKEKKEVDDYYDEEEMSYSDDDDHIYNEDYNTMLEEVARDQADEEPDREDDEDLDENDFNVTGSTHAMNSEFMITGKSIKIETPADVPQKPLQESIKKQESSGDMFEEQMMQSIIDSKGRDLYNVIYKVANEYVSILECLTCILI